MENTLIHYHKHSINYLHFGEPKHWYGISPENAPRFEKVAKSAFPAEFRNCAENMRHKTTLMSPHIIYKQNGVPVHKLVQKPGEFVITAPQAYHSGFNYGFNCAEAVNFATDTWIEYGKLARVCECAGPDVARIDMDEFVELYDEAKRKNGGKFSSAQLQALGNDKKNKKLAEGGGADVKPTESPSKSTDPSTSKKRSIIAIEEDDENETGGGGRMGGGRMSSVAVKQRKLSNDSKITTTTTSTTQSNSTTSANTSSPPNSNANISTTTAVPFTNNYSSHIFTEEEIKELRKYDGSKMPSEKIRIELAEKLNTTPSVLFTWYLKNGAIDGIKPTPNGIGGGVVGGGVKQQGIANVKSQQLPQQQKSSDIVPLRVVCDNCTTILQFVPPPNLSKVKVLCKVCKNMTVVNIPKKEG